MMGRRIKWLEGSQDDGNEGWDDVMDGEDGGNSWKKEIAHQGTPPTVIKKIIMENG
jgi:hypothetical protein